MMWWYWSDQPVKAAMYLCCWEDLDDPRDNVYEVYHFDGKKWQIPFVHQTPSCYAEITAPQEEKMLRELSEM